MSDGGDSTGSGELGDLTARSLQQLSRTAPTLLDSPTAPQHENSSDSEEVLGGFGSIESRNVGSGTKKEGDKTVQPGDVDKLDDKLAERVALSDDVENSTGSPFSGDSQGYLGSQESDGIVEESDIVPTSLAPSQSSLASELGPPDHLPASQLQQ